MYTINLRNIFVAFTIIFLGMFSLIRIGSVDAHAIFATAKLLIPAVIIMGLLGERLGYIIDNPKNITDADYKLAVLNALKKMDKSMTLEELNEKLTKNVTEPDASESEIEDDLDV